MATPKSNRSTKHYTSEELRALWAAAERKRHVESNRNPTTGEIEELRALTIEIVRAALSEHLQCPVHIQVDSPTYAYTTLVDAHGQVEMSLIMPWAQQPYCFLTQETYLSLTGTYRETFFPLTFHPRGELPRDPVPYTLDTAGLTTVVRRLATELQHLRAGWQPIPVEEVIPGQVFLFQDEEVRKVEEVFSVRGLYANPRAKITYRVVSRHGRRLYSEPSVNMDLDDFRFEALRLATLADVQTA